MIFLFKTASLIILPSDDDSEASNNSDTVGEDYIENVAKGGNISSDEEIDEMQCPYTSKRKEKWGKLYKNIDLP
ncbi:hypothetical protein TNIN_467301 [Trichonephila inaurata madagascariensis]|uniref:Uncharacterized protein n=1 Tax=Trichonephila inaurata madagascariensis TaxID=2747483 RepID=A0A8X6IIF9_9ARAC|nr:hypothetical protein TNIN_467301 [Trichonephila inaurata madagascariensis]